MLQNQASKSPKADCRLPGFQAQHAGNHRAIDRPADASYEVVAHLGGGRDYDGAGLVPITFTIE